MPDLPDQAWSIILWAGWDAISMERIVSRHRPDDIDTLTWQQIVSAVAERDAALAKRLRGLTQVERVAVLERIEAYGRAEAMANK